jgi:predicted enzyme related to lactoylglutathione lyase
MKLNYTYVCAKDFRRAEAFYRGVLFRSEPTLKTDRFVYFDVGGASFGVFDPRVTGETVRYGDNVIPTFEVEDAVALHDRLVRERVEIVMPLQPVNGTTIFQCRDTEGNVLEFFHWGE